MAKSILVQRCLRGAVAGRWQLANPGSWHAQTGPAVLRKLCALEPSRSYAAGIRESCVTGRGAAMQRRLPRSLRRQARGTIDILIKAIDIATYTSS
jgi:hypothetical protein